MPTMPPMAAPADTPLFDLSFELSALTVMPGEADEEELEEELDDGLEAASCCMVVGVLLRVFGELIGEVGDFEAEMVVTTLLVEVEVEVGEGDEVSDEN